MSQLFLALFLVAGLRPQVLPPQVQGLVSAYKASRNPEERRSICIKAIDAGIIKPGAQVAVLDAIFGTSYSDSLPRRGSLGDGLVYFSPQIIPPPGVQAGHTGWYIFFTFDSTGELESYALTNIHK